MGARSIFVAALLVGTSVIACGEERYSGTPSGLPRDVHAKPAPEEVQREPCKYGDLHACAATCQSGGDPKSCNLLGVMLEYTLDGNDDPRGASAFYRRGCDFSYYPACNNLAWLYLGGRGVKQDQFQAMRLFRSAFDLAKDACRSGDASACMMAGEFLYEGRGGLEKDAAGAVVLLDRACAGGERKGCDLASLLR